MSITFTHCVMCYTVHIYTLTAVRTIMLLTCCTVSCDIFKRVLVTITASDELSPLFVRNVSSLCNNNFVIIMR